MSARIVVTVATVAIATGACAAPHARPPADVTGWYVREDSSTREVIDVRQDSQYVHVVAPRGATPRADTARWHALGDSGIALDGFRVAPDVAAAGARAAGVQGTIRRGAQGELVLVITGDARPYVRRLRYGRQRGG